MRQQACDRTAVRKRLIEWDEGRARPARASGRRGGGRAAVSLSWQDSARPRGSPTTLASRAGAGAIGQHPLLGVGCGKDRRVTLDAREPNARGISQRRTRPRGRARTACISSAGEVLSRQGAGTLLLCPGLFFRRAWYGHLVWAGANLSEQVPGRCVHEPRGDFTAITNRVCVQCGKSSGRSRFSIL
jgi:hypothetical protein